MFAKERMGILAWLGMVVNVKKDPRGGVGEEL